MCGETQSWSTGCSNQEPCIRLLVFPFPKSCTCSPSPSHLSTADEAWYWLKCVLCSAYFKHLGLFWFIDCSYMYIAHLLLPRLYGTKCAGCNVGLCPEDLVRRAVNKVYHVHCFLCSLCKKTLSTGEQLYLVQVRYEGERREKYLYMHQLLHLKKSDIPISVSICIIVFRSGTPVNRDPSTRWAWASPTLVWVHWVCVCIYLCMLVWTDHLL